MKSVTNLHFYLYILLCIYLISLFLMSWFGSFSIGFRYFKGIHGLWFVDFELLDLRFIVYVGYGPVRKPRPRSRLGRIEGERPIWKRQRPREEACPKTSAIITSGRVAHQPPGRPDTRHRTAGRNWSRPPSHRRTNPLTIPPNQPTDNPADHCRKSESNHDALKKHVTGSYKKEGTLSEQWASS